MTDSLHSMKRQKSFRQWIKKVTTPKVAPLLSKGVDGKQQPQQGVFGVPLVVSISYARGTVSYQDTEQINHQNAAAIPLIVSKCGSYLKRNGLETEGIFRLSGSTKRVNALQQIFDSPLNSYGLHHNWKDYTIHDAGSILRRFFLQLPDPVIPTSFYQPFRNVMTDDSMYKTTDQRIEAFQSLIRQMPAVHQHLLLYVLDMLRFFAVNASITRMDASNLAAVFSPGLLSHPQHNTPVQYMISQRVIEFLIEYQNLFTMDLLLGNNNNDKEISTLVEPEEALVSPNIPRRSSVAHSLPSPANSIPPIPIGQVYVNRNSMPPTPVSPITTTTITQSPTAIPSRPASSQSDKEQQQQQDTQPIGISDEWTQSPTSTDNQSNCATASPKSTSSWNDSIKNKYLTPIINTWNQQSSLAIHQLDPRWKNIFNPLLLVWYLILGIITSSLVYEGYLICGKHAIIEPCIFFSGFFGFWSLLMYGIPLDDLILNETDTCDIESIHTILDDHPTTMEDELDLLNDMSLSEDTGSDDGMMLMRNKEIMENWQQLMSRSWRAPPGEEKDSFQQQTFPALGHDSRIGTPMDDGASMISIASRFVEVDEHEDNDYEEDECSSSSSSIGSVTEDDLQHLWSRYEQFKQDEALAEKLQQEEQVLGLQLKKQGDAYNPFLQDD